MERSIFNYNCPSEYLRDIWMQKRYLNKNFTLRAWAKQLNISSHGTFYQIIQGKRSFPKKYVKQISDSLKLNSKECLYFETLIDLKKAKTLENKSFYQKRLKEISPRRNVSIYEIETFDYLKNPLNGAIIELTNLSDFKADISWIQNRLRIKTSQLQIKNSIKLLLNLKLLKINSDGKLTRSNAHIYTKQDIHNEALQEYHCNILNLAKEQIKEQQVEDREYNASSMGIKKSDIPKIKEEIRSFLNYFIGKYETNENEADEIYNLSIQFFGLTKPTKEKTP